MDHITPKQHQNLRPGSTLYYESGSGKSRKAANVTVVEVSLGDYIQVKVAQRGNKVNLEAGQVIRAKYSDLYPRPT